MWLGRGKAGAAAKKRPAGLTVVYSAGVQLDPDRWGVPPPLVPAVAVPDRLPGTGWRASCRTFCQELVLR
ncbi:MAG TPA: hypothetical protein DCM14_07490 [Clostridiales bacterium UBA8153]|nr:hypothetical protein [Clostridiales bacterium UBA8153]